MKKTALLLLFIGSAFRLLAQENPSLLLQVVDVAAYHNASFRIEGEFFIEERARDAGALPVAITYGGGKWIKTAFDKYSMEAFKPGIWNRISVSGKIDKRADKLAVGALFAGKGKFYFDDFKLFITKSGKTVEVPLANNDFEKDSYSPWDASNLKVSSNISLTATKFTSGRQSLLIDNSLVASESFGNNTKVGKYANVNGVRLYYEVYGSGEPLLLLHGNNESIASFYLQIPELSKSYMVVALDSRGQGNSTADSTELTYELFADDVNKFLDYLHIKNANILGWSDGGNIALILAMKYPDKVKKLAASGAVLYNNSTSIPNKINTIIRNQLSEMERKGVAETDMYYRVKKILLTEPNIDPESLKQIKAPALIMAGEKDFVKEGHTRLIAEKIPNATLKIFKKASHDVPVEVATEFNKTVVDFFNKK